MEANKKSEEIISNTSPNLAGTFTWREKTVAGVLAGMVCGGLKETLASISKDAELLLKPGSTPDKGEQYRLMRDAMERFIRVTRGSIVGGVCLGMCTAAFSGLQYLGVHEAFCVMAANAAAGAAVGLILPGSPRWRARNVMLGSVIFSSAQYRACLLDLKAKEKANEGNPALNPDLDGMGEAKSGVGAAIEMPEGNLKSE